MKKLSKKSIAEVYRKCLNLVKRKPPEFFIFSKLKCCGYCDYANDVVKIDHRKDMLRTAYHECIHYIFPDWSETMVLYAESRIINRITIFENAKFLKYLVLKVYKSALQQELIEQRQKKRRKKYEARNSRSRRKRR